MESEKNPCNRSQGLQPPTLLSRPVLQMFVTLVLCKALRRQCLVLLAHQFQAHLL
jgi:hypothetical protein